MELVSATWLAVGALLSPSILARSQCPANPSPETWYVSSAADPDGADGTRARPLSTLREAVRCAGAGTTIRVLGSGRKPLVGGVFLKKGQRLLGEWNREGEARPRVTTAEGDAVVLADDNEVAGLHIEVANGAAVFGDNVTGAHLHDLVITRLRQAPMRRLDPSLCRRVVTDGTFDTGASVVRGCNGLMEPRQKAAIVLIADGKDGHSIVEHTICHTTIEDIATEARENLWSFGVDIQVAGNVNATVVIEASSLAGMVSGINGRGYQHGALTLRIQDTSVDDLLRDGVVVSTGFICSGLPSEVRFFRDCRGRQPVPVSDAKVVLYAEGYRYTDTRRRGLREDASAIEIYALDQGRSEIEIHVQDSDLMGAAQPAVFTYNVYGYAAKELIDLGCRNPAAGDPQQIGEDRAACRAAGYTSAGRNRIFGNAWGGDWSSHLLEVALIGPGRMMAQGNYWGDRAPADGRGDTLGDCSRLNWPDGDQPLQLVSDARCELWQVPGQDAPAGIDGRFHLVSDPGG